MAVSNRKTTERRKNRVRRSLKKVANGRPRLSVFRSSKHIYAQIIDDVLGKTVASASSIEKDVKSGLKTVLMLRLQQQWVNWLLNVQILLVLPM